MLLNYDDSIKEDEIQYFWHPIGHFYLFISPLFDLYNRWNLVKIFHLNFSDLHIKSILSSLFINFHYTSKYFNSCLDFPGYYFPDYFRNKEKSFLLYLSELFFLITVNLHGLCFRHMDNARRSFRRISLSLYNLSCNDILCFCLTCLVHSSTKTQKLNPRQGALS